MNPDGSEFTFEFDRFWSKNRRNNSYDEDHEECNGVNINRNFPSGFGLGPDDPCERSFRGSSPGSEPEVITVMNHATSSLVNKSILAISFHSFGQVFFTPYAYGGQEGRWPNHRHPNFQNMMDLADDSAFYIIPHYYRIGTVRQFLNYAAGNGIGGTSMDYYADIGIPYCYTIELPDFGQYGMLMPAHQIVPVCIMMITSLKSDP